MTKFRFLAPLGLAGLLLSTSALSQIGPLAVMPAQAQSVNVSLNLFFDELAPHGVWVRHPQYRYVFCPTGVDANWRPYTRGRWLNLAERGWYFESDEPFAWATYHYGRWLDDDNLGWCWVPGTKWAPAWVSWRRGGDVIGWAPLPPERDGFSVTVEVTREDFPEPYWVFVPTRSFIEPDLSVNIIIGADARNYYRETEFLGPVVVQGDVVTNNVIEVNYIEQQINQEITVYNVEEASAPAAATIEGDNTVKIFSQDIPEPAEDAAPPEAVDEAQAAELIAAEGGTIGAEQDAQTPADTDEPGEAVQTQDAEQTAPAADDAETDPTATQDQTEAAETDASEPETATDDQTDATTEEDQPNAEEQTGAEEQTDAAVPTDADQQAVETEDETQVTPDQEDAAPAAGEDEQAVESETVESEETAVPADDDVDQSEESVTVEEEVTTPDCPPQYLVDGVCQVPSEEADTPEAGSEDSSSASPDGSGSDAEGGSDTEEATDAEVLTQ